MIELYSIKDRNIRSLGHSHTEMQTGFSGETNHVSQKNNVHF